MKCGTASSPLMTLIRVCQESEEHRMFWKMPKGLAVFFFLKKQRLPDESFLENQKRKQLFWIRFACCVSATAAKPCIIATHPQLWCDHRSLGGSNRCIRPLYVCRCLLWLLHGEKTQLLGLSEEALSLKLKLSRSLRLDVLPYHQDFGLTPEKSASAVVFHT